MKSDTTKVRLGDLVKDQITGFKGIAVAKTLWLNGCLRVTIQAQEVDKEGKSKDITVDIEQLEVLKAQKMPGPEPDPAAPAKSVAAVAPIARKHGTGGPTPEPVQRANPRRR